MYLAFSVPKKQTWESLHETSTTSLVAEAVAADQYPCSVCEHRSADRCWLLAESAVDWLHGQDTMGLDATVTGSGRHHRWNLGVYYPAWANCPSNHSAPHTGRPGDRAWPSTRSIAAWLPGQN